MRDNSCGILIEYQGLFLLAKAYGRNDVWGIPKGKRESGETKQQAALRETFEETGLDLSFFGLKFLGDYKNSRKDLSVFYCHVTKDVFDSKLICHTNIAGTNNPEIDKYEWATLERAKELTRGKHSFYIFDKMVDKVKKIDSIQTWINSPK